MQYHTIIHIDKNSIMNHSGHVWSVMLSTRKTHTKTHASKEHHQSCHESLVDGVLSTSRTQAEITQIQERSPLTLPDHGIVDGTFSHKATQLEIHTYTKTDIAGHPFTSRMAGGVLPLQDTTESTHIHKNEPSLTILSQGMVDGVSARKLNTYTKDIIDHLVLLRVVDGAFTKQT